MCCEIVNTHDNFERVWFTTGMKTIIFTSLLLVLSNLASAAELSGHWNRSNRGHGEKPVHFIYVDGFYRSTSQERFIFENGRLSHTIDQSVKVTVKEDLTLEGTVDFYDSRGCSFKNLTVKGEFQNDDLVNILMTVPRYQYRTITTRPSGQVRVPVYCSDYYNRRYVCGYRWENRAPTSVRHECQLLDYVEVPVQLERVNSL